MDLDAIRQAIEQASGSRPEEAPRSVGGGCINETFQLGEYFLKLNTPDKLAAFEAEQTGLEELNRSNTVRVPQPICSGATSSCSFLVLEFLPLHGRSAASQETLGRQLAAMHRFTSSAFGSHRDNFIGATPQPNASLDSWVDFLRDQRLGHMLRLAEMRGYSFRGASSLLDALEDFFPSDQPAPSLLHGDLWGGNADALPDDSPVIFDPAVYFGDREADLAMTTLFGGFSPNFYAAYQETWPLPDGHRSRVDLYNLYHILNHAILFGGGYARQAQSMIDQLLRRK